MKNKRLEIVTCRLAGGGGGACSTARVRARPVCWASREVLNPSSFCSGLNTSLGAKQVLMHRKSCSILIMYVII